MSPTKPVPSPAVTAASLLRPQPRILLFDIETTPHVSLTWGKYQQNVTAFLRHSHMLSFSAKWLDGKQVTKGLIDYPDYAKDLHDDLALVRELWDLMNEADVVVAHNGRAFDTKKVNARFNFHHITPPSFYKILDTKEMSKKYFNFTSNSLDDIAQYLGLGRKLPHEGIELWIECMNGNPKAWRKMKRYNAHDVVLLEAVYRHMLPWMEGHPNLSTLREGRCCPKCGSENLWDKGEARTQSTVYRRYQCGACGGWCRDVAGKLRSLKGIVKGV